VGLLALRLAQAAAAHAMVLVGAPMVRGLLERHLVRRWRAVPRSLLTATSLEASRVRSEGWGYGASVPSLVRGGAITPYGSRLRRPSRGARELVAART
jgi:hypothetical protein